MSKQAELAALEAARNKGVKTIERDGEKIEFRSLEEMDAIIRRLKRELSPRRSRRLVKVGRFVMKGR